jgi:hypothetical protein
MKMIEGFTICVQGLHRCNHTNHPRPRKNMAQAQEESHGLKNAQTKHSMDCWHSLRTSPAVKPASEND